MTVSKTLICSTEDLYPDEPKSFGEITVLLHQNEYYAFESRCPHMGYPMNKGLLKEGIITCAWHHWDFDLKNGGCYRGACHDLKTYPVIIENNQLYLVDNKKGPSLKKVQQQLCESMMSSDLYLMAQSLGQLLKLNQSPLDLARLAIQQAFQHAQTAHPSPQASYEIQAILDAAELATYYNKNTSLSILLQGLRTAAGPSGIRQRVSDLPAPIRSIDFQKNLSRYTLDPSPLGIERLLLSALKQELPQWKSTLIQLSTSNTFLHHPEVFLCTSSLIYTNEVLSDNFQEILPALLSWSLGISRRTPDLETREATEWIQKEEALQLNNNPNHEELKVDACEEALQSSDIIHFLEKIKYWIQKGHTFNQLINVFTQIGLNRYRSLWLANGNLWPHATSSLRLIHAVHKVSQYITESKTQILWLIALDLFRNRWLKVRKNNFDINVENQIVEDSFQLFQQAFHAGEALTAREQGLTFLRLGGEPQKLLETLLLEDLDPVHLNTLRAINELIKIPSFREDALAGAIVQGIDRRAQRNIESAAKFGRSYLVN